MADLVLTQSTIVHYGWAILLALVLPIALDLAQTGFTSLRLSLFPLNRARGVTEAATMRMGHFPIPDRWKLMRDNQGRFRVGGMSVMIMGPIYPAGCPGHLTPTPSASFGIVLRNGDSARTTISCKMPPTYRGQSGPAPQVRHSATG